jgi:hypothetical protein
VEEERSHGPAVRLAFAVGADLLAELPGAVRPHGGEDVERVGVALVLDRSVVPLIARERGDQDLVELQGPRQAAAVVVERLVAVPVVVSEKGIITATTAGEGIGPREAVDVLGSLEARGVRRQALTESALRRLVEAAVGPGVGAEHRHVGGAASALAAVAVEDPRDLVQRLVAQQASGGPVVDVVQVVIEALEVLELGDVGGKECSRRQFVRSASGGHDGAG